MFEEYVLDITFEPECYAFCPLDDQNDIVLGLTIIAERCPGELVGMFSLLDNPSEHCKTFIEQHPNWLSDFKKEEE